MTLPYYLSQLLSTSPHSLPRGFPLSPGPVQEEAGVHRAPHCTLQSHRGPRGSQGKHPSYRAVVHRSCGWTKPYFRQMGGCGTHIPSLWRSAVMSVGHGAPLTALWFTFFSCSVGSPPPHRESTASLTLIRESLIFSEHNKNVPEVWFDSPGYVTAVCPVC